ncbi:MAG: hypothetical protein K8W52_30725 [Deltaproteobacteria bacterium]|nr:hypothetical protein [Deltaproteobacteria bacterium]
MLKLAALLVFTSACITNGPQIDAASPTTVARGATVTLTGLRFCQDAGVAADGSCAGPVTGTVDIDVDAPIRAETTAWSDTEIKATIPTMAALGSTDIYLTSSGRSSNAVEITIQ